jgi:hypothetical protein
MKSISNYQITGNYTLEDLHRQYTKYRHKRNKHTPLNDVYPDVAVFFPSYCNDNFFTVLSVNVISKIRTSIA